MTDNEAVLNAPAPGDRAPVTPLLSGRASAVPEEQEMTRKSFKTHDKYRHGSQVTGEEIKYRR